MNAMSKYGFDPDVALWEEAGSLLHSIKFTRMKESATGEQFKMYWTTSISLGRPRVIKRLNSSRYSVLEVRVPAL